MEDRERTPQVKRLRWLARAALAWGLIVFGRLVWLQVIEHETLSRQAAFQQTRRYELMAPRGSIVDRNGALLAVSQPADSVAVNPRILKDPTVAAAVLARVLHLERAPLEERIREARDNRRGFLWVKKKISPDESERLKAAAQIRPGVRVPWLDLREESRRVYPKGRLAAHVLGSVDHQEGGNAGLELSLESDLAGVDGYVEVLTDGRHNGIDTLTTVPSRPGKTIALTIDERLQYVCDRALRTAMLETKSHTGTIVVMNPRNGDILALASAPVYDPNARVMDPGNPARHNVAATYACEPGSVFKIFTAAAALETTNLRPESVINCGNGVINLYGQVIHDLHSHSALRMEEVIWHSSNIGAVNIGLAVGKERLYDYLTRFGFGKVTGVPLPGESRGLLRSPDRWNKGSIGYVSFGHEISTTTLQLAQAGSVIANGGYRVKPRLVLWRKRENGNKEAEPMEPAVRVLKPESAITVRRMMGGVVLQGTGKRARLAGYTAGGKTGTAQIFNLATRRYEQKQHNSTFLGMAPLNDPAIVVVVTLNGTARQGGQVSAPVFKEVATAALRLLGVTRDLPDVEPPEKTLLLAAVVDGRAGELQQAGGVSHRDGGMSHGEGLPKGEREPGEETGLLVGPRVPDWRGKSVRAVLRESLETGMQVEILGTGLAREQSPQAGQILPAGGRIRVQFAR